MSKSEHVHKRRNVSVLLYHFMRVAKYRRVAMSSSVDAILRDTCLKIELRYEIRFLEIGLDGDHAHFLMQSVPTYSATKIVRTMKSLIAREVLLKDACVKDLL